MLITYNKVLCNHLALESVKTQEGMLVQCWWWYHCLHCTILPSLESLLHGYSRLIRRFERTGFVVELGNTLALR